jgi:hypothetical protein
VDEDEHVMLIDDGHVRDRSDLHLISHSGLLAQEEELRKSTLSSRAPPPRPLSRRLWLNES